MPIGDSKGAFYEDEFRMEAAPWFLDPKLDAEMVVDPATMQTNKQLDKAELEPSTGMGIEVSYLEDRRSDTPNLDMNRLMDPEPLSKSIGGSNSKGAYDEKLIGRDVRIPSKLAKDLGIEDVDRISVEELYKRLGIEPIEEDKPISD